VLAAGPVTGVGSSWTSPGWRTARSADAVGTDPWGAVGAADVATGLGVGAAGELTVGGLEWLGARVYDPASRGFLSVDPLDPVPGAGWAGNPYAYAGNDPLHAVDPRGLSPVTDAELRAYAAQHAGAISAVGDWMQDNWEYVAGGAMVVAGGVLIATGVGGPLGMMLVSAGADTIIQKATTGDVNWGQVAVTGALGGFGGAGIAARAGLTGTRAAVVAGMSSGGISSGITGGYSYATGPGPHTVGGFARATAFSAGAGALTGGAGGAAGHAIGGRIMGALTTNPSADTMVMGRIMGSRVIPYAEAHGAGYYNGTPQLVHNGLEGLPGVQLNVDLWVNKKWINYQMMEGKNLFDVGGPSTLAPSDFYSMELQQTAGYPHYSQAAPDLQNSFDLSGGVPH
jgi:RHS repeat-associated protein